MTDPTTIWRGEHLFPRTDISITKLVSETYLAVNGIAQGDRLSMATSVESRLPLVDYKLIETVIGLRKARPDHHLPAKSGFEMQLKILCRSLFLKEESEAFLRHGGVGMKRFSIGISRTFATEFLSNLES